MPRLRSRASKSATNHPESLHAVWAAHESAPIQHLTDTDGAPVLEEHSAIVDAIQRSKDTTSEWVRKALLFVAKGGKTAA